MKITKHILLTLVLAFISHFTHAQQNAKTTRILFIFDASNSMFGQWQNHRKIDVAKKLMYETIDKLAPIPNLQLGLRMYGHQTKIMPGQQDCDDTKLEVPFAPDNYQKIKTRIKSLDPKGTTPIARSLLYAGDDFTPCDNCDDVIILITDGIEACDEDPCAVAKMLREKGITVRPYIIGMALDSEALANFKCVGKVYDAMTEEAFKNVMKVVMDEALNNTTVQVLLNNTENKPRETDVTLTFTNQNTGEILYTFMHTLDDYNRPDTLTLSPVYTYQLTVHTTPQVEVQNIQLSPGTHNTIEAYTPQGTLDLRVLGANDKFTDIKCIVRQKGKAKTLNAQPLNTTDRYIVGTYDLEFLSLPRITMEDVEITQSKRKRIEIPQSGQVTILMPLFGDAAIFTTVQGKREWVCNLPRETLNHTLKLQPGDYTVVYRPESKRSSAYTSSTAFTITPGGSVRVDL